MKTYFQSLEKNITQNLIVLKFYHMYFLGVLVLISFASLLVPEEDVLSKMFLLLVPLLFLMNLSNTAGALVPPNHVTSLQVWLLCCITLVLLPLIQ